MKKKVRKYAEGGEPKFERSTYERARAMLRDNPHTADELTPSLDNRIARARERIAGVMQSMPEPAPRPASRPAPTASRPAPASAVSQDRPAYPTARRVAEESMDAEDADLGRAMQRVGLNRDTNSAAPASSRGLQNTMGVRAAQQMEEKGSIYSPDYGRPRAEREQRQSLRDLAAGLERTDEAVQAAKKRADTAAARREAAYADVAGAEDYEAGQAAKKMMREAARAPRLQNTMGVRAAQQMEEKGSIYSPDYGRPRAEREQRQAEREANERNTREVERQARQDMLERRRTPIEAAALKPKETEEDRAAERAKREAEARGRESDTRERERQAQEERDRRKTEARRKQAEEEERKAAERSRTARRAEVESNRARDEAEEGAVRRAPVREEVRRQRSATPPVPPSGSRAFTNNQIRRRNTAGPAMMNSPGFKSGGMVSSASKRADGIAQRGKTRGKVY